MPNDIEYALMAGRAYQSTRADINRFPVPEGWSEPLDKRKVLPGGFEAGYFQRGTEIVISYAGTGPGLSDWDANSGLALGFGSEQLRQAALYYLEVKEISPPGTVITFTGHSLGGGLAALMGVFFDEQAVTFDQAPFANSASTGIRDDLVSYLNGQGYSNSELATLAPELLSYDGYGTRTANVTGYFVQGEALQYVPFSTIGSQTILTQNSTGLDLITGPISLHSQTLLTAFLENDAFRAITFKLPELLKMVFDEALYARDPSDKENPQRNFLELLIRHQTGVTGSFAADAMLDRFTLDLQKIAQDGGFTLTNAHITRTLVAFAMQMYYENPEASVAGKQLFSDVTGGIRFDRTDVSASLSAAKGWQMYFQNYLGEDLTLEEHRIVLQLLPAATDWFIQAGAISLSAIADASKAFMLGGIGNDWMAGGSQADLLIGNAGDDTLKGGANNDTLIGGAGFDTYFVNAGDGSDTILDSDGSGIIKFGAIDAQGSAGVAPDKWYQLSADNWIDAQNSISYTRVTAAGEVQLFVRKGDSTVLIKGWSEGELAITLGAGTTSPDPVALLTGDSLPDYLEAAAGGQRVEGLAGADMILGSGASGADHLLGGDGNDWIVGNGGADLIEGGLGADYISGMTGNSQVYGGDGNDLITAALAEGIQLANIGNIPGLTADILWADTQSGFGRSTALVYDSAGNLDLSHGSVPLTSYGGASALGGGWTFSMAFGGGTWTITYSHPTLAPGGKTPTGTWEHFTVPVSLTEGVFLFGEAGDDLIVGNDGADTLDGGSGQDQLFGHARNDVLDGGADDMGWRLAA